MLHSSATSIAFVPTRVRYWAAAIAASESACYHGYDDVESAGDGFIMHYFIVMPGAFDFHRAAARRIRHSAMILLTINKLAPAYFKQIHDIGIERLLINFRAGFD